VLEEGENNSARDGRGKEKKKKKRKLVSLSAQ
jgi:hypothetical protein